MINNKAPTVYIYAIESDNLVKIGFSVVPSQALKLIERNCATPCRIIATWPRGKMRVVNIYKRFNHIRNRNGWFHLKPELSAFLNAHKSGIVK